ncbi:hypothetical protein ACROYT_G002432 [Oculina patagonica]
MSRCQLYIDDNVVKITFKMTADQWKEDTFRESISRAFTEHCSNTKTCNLRNSLDGRTTSRRTSLIANIKFRPDDVLVLRRYPEEKPGMFTVVTAVLIPLDEPQSTAERETIPAVILCRMVVRTSKGISKYMGNISIELINGEKDPPCVSDAGNNDSTNSKGGETAGRRKEELSSVGIAGAVVGTLIFLMMIIVAALFVLRFRRRPTRVTKSALSSSFNNPGYEPHPRDYNGDDSDASPFTIPEYEEISTVLFQRQGKPSGRQERDPLYAEIGPSLAAKGGKTRDHQRDGEIQSPQVNGHGLEKIIVQLDASLLRYTMISQSIKAGNAKTQLPPPIQLTNRSLGSSSPTHLLRRTTVLIEIRERHPPPVIKEKLPL